MSKGVDSWTVGQLDGKNKTNMGKYNYEGLVKYAVSQGFSLAESYEDWTKLAFSLSTLGEAGRELFHAVSSNSAKYNRKETDRKFSEAIRSNRRTDISTLIYMCQQAGIDTNRFYDNNKKASTKPVQSVINPIRHEKKEISIISAEFMEKSKSFQSNLIYFLCGLFDRYTLEFPTIERLMDYYYLGATKEKGVIYWQIDISHRVRTGKIMKYDRETGHRIKDGNGVNWVHSLMKKRGLLPNDWELSQCLFGEHLIGLYPNKPIALVESEKTALIGAGYLPKFLWVATGGKMNFSERMLQPLKGRTVIAFPDADAYNDWKKKAAELAKQGINITISDVLERVATDEDRTNKIDVADLLVRQAREQEGRENAP